MKIEDIDKFANQFAFIETPDARERFLFSSGFKAGAKWRINIVWHDASEKPIYNKPILMYCFFGGCFNYKVSYNDDILTNRAWDYWSFENCLVKWAYIEDLLPENKD